MARQECPACGRHYEPPGPCRNWDGDGDCGYLEPPRTIRSAVPTPARAPIPRDGHTLGRTVDPSEGLAGLRAELEAAKRRKGAA